MTSRSRFAAWCKTALTVAPLILLNFTSNGCGGAEQVPTASVTGKVTLKGEPVTGGTLTFAPIASGAKPPGKPAAGAVQSNGLFTLGTYAEKDGAVVGKHRITYSPPIPEAPMNDTEAPMNDKEHAEAKKSPYDGLKPLIEEVEVKAGSNSIDIELIPVAGTGS
jgi:hypothetical protein